MLLEHALLLFENQIVDLKGVWTDPNREIHEGRVLSLSKAEDGHFKVALEGLWGGRPVAVPQSAILPGPAQPDSAHASDVQFGTLLLKVDHFVDDPLEWLAQSNIDIGAASQ